VVTEISERVSGLYNHPEGVAAAFIEHVTRPLWMLLISNALPILARHTSVRDNPV